MSDDGARLLAFPQAPDAIELRHLRAFVAVAEELNFGRAAAQLYVSQPALSRQIRSLERLVGCELLRRSTHRVELTLAGDALLDRARRVLREVDDAVVATRSVGGELVERAARLWAPIAEVWGPNGDLQAARAAYETLMAQFERPPGVTVRSTNAGGVPALELVPEGDDVPTTVLYFHGGGHALGSAFGYQGLTGALASAAGAGVLVLEYRLAPEHPFPAALDDAVRAYAWLIERTPAARVTIAGDSSGGGLAMSLLIRLKQEGLPLPGGAALLCPWVDLTLDTLERHAGRDAVPEEMLAQMRGAAEAYLAGHPAGDPVVSPLGADLSGLPPLLVQAATGDRQVADAHRLSDHADAHGVDVRFELFPVDTHVFHIFWAFLPEAADALEQAGRFVRETAAVLDDRERLHG
jgi:acetyl esterase/lipase